MTVSMLVPLDVTLFGWPTVPETSPLQELGLLVGIPLVVIVVVFAIAKGNQVMRAAKHGPGPQPSDPVWMGGRATSVMGGAEIELADVADEQRRQIEAFPSPAGADAAAGGASARW